MIWALWLMCAYKIWPFHTLVCEVANFITLIETLYSIENVTQNHQPSGHIELSLLIDILMIPKLED